MIFQSIWKHQERRLNLYLANYESNILLGDFKVDIKTPFMKLSVNHMDLKVSLKIQHVLKIQKIVPLSMRY